MTVCSHRGRIGVRAAPLRAERDPKPGSAEGRQFERERAAANSQKDVEMNPSDLRTELPYLLLATIVLVAGVATAAFSALKVKDRALLYFGVFAALYATRLLILNRIFRSAFEIPTNVSEWCVAVISYTILVPGALFFRVLIGHEWRNAATWVLGTTIVFAPIAIAWAAIAGNPWAPDRVNNVIVITSMLLAASFIVYRYRRGQEWLILCFLLFLATVVMKNLQFNFGRYDPEPLGFLVLLTALGSLYDFITLDERRLTILVADVSGHGVPAALIASMLKVLFGAQNEYAANPAEVLSRINSALNGTLDRQFVTAACAHIDLVERTVHYAGAGHPASFLWKSSTRELIELAENGLFLGPFRTATYRNISHAIEPGDFVLFYTDGLVEGTSLDGQPFGDDRLKRFIRANTAEEPKSFVDRLLQAALVGVREDDVTLVLAKVNSS